MISKPVLNREERLREERARRQCQPCFDRVVEALGEGETLGEPVRVGDQVVIPVVRVDVEGRGPQPDPGSESLTLTFGERRTSPKPKTPKRGA